MPIDPRMVAAPSSPSAPPASAAALNNLYQGLLDLSRRVDRIDAARTVVDPRSLDGTNLKLGAISASEIEVGNIVASIMTVGAVNASHIDAASIRSSVLDAAVLTAGNAYITSLRASILDAGILTATNATIGTLRASILNATQIIADGLAVQVLNAVKGAVTDLSSVSANTGTLTASLIKTDNSPNARVEIGTTAGGIKGYNSSNALTFGFDLSTGTATVGAITVTGAAGTQVPSSTLTGFLGGGNLLANSSFESTDPALPAALWGLNGATQALSTAQAFHGTTSLAITNTGASVVGRSGYTLDTTTFNAVKGRPVVVSAWLYVPTGVGGLVASGVNSPVRIQALGGAAPSFDAVETLTGFPRDTWTRVVVKATVPSASTSVRIDLRNTFTTGAIYYDGIQLELGDAATAYNPKADEIIYGSITTVELAANAVKATNVDAGAITADKISLGVPAGASVRNGNFNEGNPTTGSTLANGWVLQLGNAATVQTDAAWPRIARIVNATNISSAMTQDVTLPLGRSILRLWVKTTGVANAVPGTSGATLSVVAGTGTGTIGAVTRIVGTTGWTLIERDVTVTAVGTFAVRIRLDDAGTADFANYHIIPATTGTTLTPTSIDAMTITGATFQTAAPGVARTVLDVAGLRFNDGTADTVNLSATAGGLTLLATALDTPPDSRKLRLLHTAGGATAGELYAFSNNTATPTFSNGTFDVDLSGWTTSAPSGTVTRDTTTTQAGAGSIKFDTPNVLFGPNIAYATITGTFKAGVAYRIPFYARGAPRVVGDPNSMVKLWTSTARTTLIQRQYVNMVSASWTKNIIEYRPTADTTNPVLELAQSTVGPDTIYYDTVGPVEIPSATILSSIAKTGGGDIGQILLSTTDASSVKTSALLLSSDGRSDFMQLAATAPRRKVNMDWGVSSANFPTSATSAVVNVQHNLGVIPSAVLVHALGKQNGIISWASDDAATWSSTSFAVQGRRDDGTAIGPGTVAFAWFVIA